MKTAEEIAEATGRRTIAVQCDIADAAAVDAMVKKVADTFGRLDIAVNNAGISIPIKGRTICSCRAGTMWCRRCS